jgi:hypothetical protein
MHPVRQTLNAALQPVPGLSGGFGFGGSGIGFIGIVGGGFGGDQGFPGTGGGIGSSLSGSVNASGFPITYPNVFNPPLIPIGSLCLYLPMEGS